MFNWIFILVVVMNFVSLDCVLLQIQKVVLALGDYMNISCHACIGGTNLREDVRKLDSGVQIIVGTPGRVYDMITRRVLGRLLFCSLIYSTKCISINFFVLT